MRLSFRDRPLVFVDVEASGLDRSSFPVEPGWCADDGHEPESSLIRPDEDWPLTDAYDAGLAIHGIPYADLLANGLHLLDLPKRLERAWTGAILVSDAVPQDTAWIARAYDAIVRPMPWKLVEFDVVFAAVRQWAGIPIAEAAAVAVAARRLPVPHRAGPDARRLHRIVRALVDPTWRAVLKEPTAVAAGSPSPSVTGTGKPP